MCALKVLRKVQYKKVFSKEKEKCTKEEQR